MVSKAFIIEKKNQKNPEQSKKQQQRKKWSVQSLQSWFQCKVCNSHVQIFALKSFGSILNASFNYINI